MNRPQRNHNPLNIRRTKDVWRGQLPIQTDKSFVQFKDDLHGFRAAFVILRNYTRNGVRSLEAIIIRWAPRIENDTESYIRFCSQRLGVPKTLVFDFDNRELMCALVRSMAFMESGQWYDLDLIEEAYDFACEL